MDDAIKKIGDLFAARGNARYGSEPVSQLQHALQSAQLARESGAKSSQIVAALLHDIGHLWGDHDLPESDASNLDDQHEYRANRWLREHFGPSVADPIRLHVLAKRYLCTVDPGYEARLSPVSRKSYYDQGGTMSEDEVAEFESEPSWQDALALRRWDDQAKDPNRDTPSWEDFLDEIESCLRPSASRSSQAVDEAQGPNSTGS